MDMTALQTQLVLRMSPKVQAIPMGSALAILSFWEYVLGRLFHRVKAAAVLHLGTLLYQRKLGHSLLSHEICRLLYTLAAEFFHTKERCQKHLTGSCLKHILSS